QGADAAQRRQDGALFPRRFGREARRRGARDGAAATRDRPRRRRDRADRRVARVADRRTASRVPRDAEASDGEASVMFARRKGALPLRVLLLLSFAAVALVAAATISTMQIVTTIRHERRDLVAQV